MSDPGTPGWGAIRVRGAREMATSGTLTGEHLAWRVAVPA